MASTEVHHASVPAGVARVVDHAGSDRTVASTLAKLFADLGVTHAFGVSGGAISPFWVALLESRISVIHCRHESGAAFAALEAHAASGRPSLLFTTTGPGLANALNGVWANRVEGGKLIVVSASTPPAQRGRWAIQETAQHRMTTDALTGRGSLFDHVTNIEAPEQVGTVASALRVGLAQPQGFTAHVSLSPAMQTTPAVATLPQALVCHRRPTPSGDAVADIVRKLSAGEWVLWLGHGARDASAEIRELVDRTDVPVICSPRAKGIVSEDDARFLGVSGLGGHDEVARHMAQHAPPHALVLGTRLGEGTSSWAQGALPAKGLVHVDLDPEAFAAAFPAVPTLAVQADIGEVVRRLLPHAERLRCSSPRVALSAPCPSAPRHGSVRPAFLMDAVQRLAIDAADLTILADVGNAIPWTVHHLRVRRPGGLRVSVGWASMGAASAGIIGTSAVTGRRVLALVGDGALLMQNEINTAAKYNLPAIWVVLNDGRYNMAAQGLAAQQRAVGLDVATFPTVDFAAVADGMGIASMTVTDEHELEPALSAALTAPGPFLIDVHIDASDGPPIGSRTATLALQGVGSGRAPLTTQPARS